MHCFILNIEREKKSNLVSSKTSLNLTTGIMAFETATLEKTAEERNDMKQKGFYRLKKNSQLSSYEKERVETDRLYSSI